MYIIEGADCVGKTNAAQRFASKLGVEYIHFRKPEPTWTYLQHGLRQLAEHENCVVDRFHLGALIYGMLMCNDEHARSDTLEGLRTVRDYLKDAALVIVMYDRNTAALVERLETEKRDQMFSAPRILSVNYAYRSIVGTPWTDLAYDVADGWPADKLFNFWIAEHSRRGLG